MTSRNSERMVPSNHESEAQQASVFEASNILPKKIWHELVEQAVIAAHEENEPLSIIFLDIDNLKDVNDTLGHAEGDQVIEDFQNSVIKLVHDSLRSKPTANNDRALDLFSVSSSKRVGMLSAPIAGEQREIKPGRIGGDEFGILCYTDSKGVEIIANRIRNVFRNTISERFKAVDVDVSLGVSTLEPQMTSTSFLRLADERLYMNKISHLRPLSAENTVMLKAIIETLNEINVPLRHVAKYAQLFANNPDILQIAPSYKD